MKVCHNCKIEKTETEFAKYKSSKDGLQRWCKECQKLRRKIYYTENKEKIKQKSEQYREANPDKTKQAIKSWKEDNQEKIKQYQKDYRILNVEKIKQKRKDYYENNKENIKQVNKDWKKDNGEKVRIQRTIWKNNNPEYYKNYSKDRRQTDLMFRIMNNLRVRIRHALNGRTKSQGTCELIGCSFDCFRTHISSQFQHGMTWDNYGEWHIDHIIPLSLATTVQELYDLCHYTNLQPLWAMDNFKKGKTINPSVNVKENCTRLTARTTTLIERRGTFLHGAYPVVSCA